MTPHYSDGTDEKDSDSQESEEATQSINDTMIKKQPNENANLKVNRNINKKSLT